MVTNEGLASVKEWMRKLGQNIITEDIDELKGQFIPSVDIEGEEAEERKYSVGISVGLSSDNHLCINYNVTKLYNAYVEGASAKSARYFYSIIRTFVTAKQVYWKMFNIGVNVGGDMNLPLGSEQQKRIAIWAKSLINMDGGVATISVYQKKQYNINSQEALAAAFKDFEPTSQFYKALYEIDTRIRPAAYNAITLNGKKVTDFNQVITNIKEVIKTKDAHKEMLGANGKANMDSLVNTIRETRSAEFQGIMSVLQASLKKHQVLDGWTPSESNLERITAEYLQWYKNDGVTAPTYVLTARNWMKYFQRNVNNMSHPYYVIVNTDNDPTNKELVNIYGQDVVAGMNRHERLAADKLHGTHTASGFHFHVYYDISDTENTLENEDLFFDQSEDKPQAIRNQFDADEVNRIHSANQEVYAEQLSQECEEARKQMQGTIDPRLVYISLPEIGEAVGVEISVPSTKTGDSTRFLNIVETAFSQIAEKFAPELNIVQANQHAQDPSRATVKDDFVKAYTYMMCRAMGIGISDNLLLSVNLNDALSNSVLQLFRKTLPVVQRIVAQHNMGELADFNEKAQIADPRQVRMQRPNTMSMTNEDVKHYLQEAMLKYAGLDENVAARMGKKKVIDENEVESRGDKFLGGDIHNENNWKKEYSNLKSDPVICWKCTKSTLLPSIIENGFSRVYSGANAGIMYGEGEYTNFNLRQTLSAGINYGDIILECAIDGGIQDFLIMEPDVARLAGVGFFSQQVDRHHGFREYLESRGIRVDDMSKALAAGLIKSSAAAVKVVDACGGSRNVSINMGKFGVGGVIYFGGHDFECVVPWNFDRIRPVRYIKKDDAPLRDINHLNWIDINDRGYRPEGTITDIKFFMAQFGDKYEFNDRMDRGHDGVVAVRDKKTGKDTYISVEKANAKFKDPSVDERLFGNVEFDVALSFEDGMGFVVLNDEQYLINKEGDLFNLDDTTTPVGNVNGSKVSAADVRARRASRDDSLSQVNESNGLFGNLLNEVMEEERIEHPDGVIEIDNFELVRKYMSSDDPDKVWFVQIVKRHKDNPSQYFAHNSCDYITYYLFHDASEMDGKMDEIKTLCKQLNARAYVYLNPRSAKAINDYAENVLKARFKRHYNERHLQGHEIEFAAGQSKDWEGRDICFIDVDTNDEKAYDKICKLLDVKGIKPLDVYRSTNNGWHIILPDKEAAKRLDFSILDNGKDLGRWATAGVEIDKATLLYCALKPKGYGVQQKMQHRLGK